LSKGVEGQFHESVQSIQNVTSVYQT